MPTPGARDAAAGRHLALLALAALIYLVLAGSLMRTALFGHDVVSPAAFWAQNGPFPTGLRTRVPDGINLLSDNVSQFTPWLRYAADGFAHDGTIPLWKSLALCGAPLVGNGQSALFYPTNLLAIVLGAPDWFGAAQSLFKLVGGALAAFLLARHLRLSFQAALLAGLVFGFGGYQAVFLQHPHTLVSLLLPLLLLCTDRLVLAPSAGRLAALALVAGLQHLGGHAETAVHCQLAALALGAARAWSLRRSSGVPSDQAPLAEAAGPGVARRYAWVIGGLALGAVLGAIQIVPQLEYIALSDGFLLRELRAETTPATGFLLMLGFLGPLALALLCAAHLARGRRLLWLSAAGLLAATFVGLLAGLPGGLSPTWIALLSPDWFGPVDHMLGAVNYVEQNGAFAGAALPLALFGLIAGASRPRIRASGSRDGGPDPSRGAVLAAGIAALLGVLALFRAPGVSDLLGVLPGLRLAENTRLSLLALLAVGVLAAFGLDAIGRARAPGPGPGPRIRLALLLGVLLLGGWGALAYGVSDGRIPNTNVPMGSNDIVVHDLPFAEARSLMPRAILDRVASGLAIDGEPHKVFAGWFASPPGTWPAGLPQPTPGAGEAGSSGEVDDALAASAARPPVVLAGARLMYTRDGRSVEAILVPALRDGDPATPWTGPDGAPVCVFAAIVPMREFPPEVSIVRLRLSLGDGRALMSTPLQARDDPGATPFPFPAQPAPGDAPSQLLLLLLTSVALLALLDARGALRQGARTALLVLCGTSLLPFTAVMLPLLPAWALYPKAGALDAMAALGNDARILVKDPSVMPAEIPVVYGIRDVKGYDALHPVHTTALLRRATDHAPWLTSIEALPAGPDIGLPLLGAMGVRCIANWNDAPVGLSRIPFRDEALLPVWAPFRLVRNPFFLPRARLVSGWSIEADEERALDALADPDFPHSRTVILDAGVARAASAEPAGTARLTLDRPDHVRVSVQPREPCLLVLADTWFPGWKALVDGTERPIVRVNVAFRGVALSPGDRSVEFLYEPLSFRLGAAASAAGALLLLGLAAGGWRAASRRARTAAATATSTTTTITSATAPATASASASVTPAAPASSTEPAQE